MDFKEWVRGLVNEHKNPTVKFEINKSKIFNRTDSEEEKGALEQRLNALKKVLNCERVERRCARSKLTWIPQDKVARLDKGVGTKFWFMGYHDKTGKFVYPEEAMFLFETNRAEISWNSVPINIDQAFTLFFNGPQELEKYKAYRKLALRGFEIKRYKEKTVKSGEPAGPSKRTKLECDDKISGSSTGDEVCPSKRIKLDTDQIDLVSSTKSELESSTKSELESWFTQIFERLKTSGPQHCSETIEKSCDYTLEQKMSGLKRDYNLHFMFGEELDPSVGFYKGSSNVYCSVNDNDALFFRFIPVELPSLF